jgi:hypothetical protein
LIGRVRNTNLAYFPLFNKEKTYGNYNIYTKVSIIPSNQLLVPSRAIKFSIIAAGKIVTNSNNVNTKENG